MQKLQTMREAACAENATDHSRLVEVRHRSKVRQPELHVDQRLSMPARAWHETRPVRRHGQRSLEADIALGSASELRYLLQLAEELGMLEGADLADCRTRSAHVVRALYRLQSSVGALADDHSR